MPTGVLTQGHDGRDNDGGGAETGGQSVASPVPAFRERPTTPDAAGRSGTENERRGCVECCLCG
eukprot:2780754-Rhodomonas_salina.2